MDLFDLTGRTALVTGAGRGIGLAIASALAAAGADVVGVGSRIRGDGAGFASAVEGAGRRSWTFDADLADRVALRRLVAQVEEHAPPIDILVNNAGIIRRAPALEHAEADWDAVLDVDLSAPFLLSQALGRGMVERGHGRIVSIASMLSFQGGVRVPGYAAAKHGVLGVVRALSDEWSVHGVTVNAVAPGYIATDATAALRDDPDRSAGILARIPAGRWGRAEDVGGAVVFLASDAAAYVTGAVIPVDGGWLAR